jgi:hypothetical protein
MDGAPRIGTVSMLAAIELRRDPAGLSCSELARRLQRRKADVLRTLVLEPRFTCVGATRYARWIHARGHGNEWVPLREVDATTGSARPAEVQTAA